MPCNLFFGEAKPFHNFPMRVTDDAYKERARGGFVMSLWIKLLWSEREGVESSNETQSGRKRWSGWGGPSDSEDDFLGWGPFLRITWLIGSCYTVHFSTQRPQPPSSPAQRIITIIFITIKHASLRGYFVDPHLSSIVRSVWSSDLVYLIFQDECTLRCPLENDWRTKLWKR